MFLEHQLRWEGMGLIDLDASYFVQLVVFLVFLFVMNALLFKPLLRVFDERRRRTAGAREEAAQDEQKARGMTERYQTKMSAALEEGAELRARLRSDGLGRAHEQAAAARVEYTRRVEDGARQARSEYEMARGEVPKAAEPLAEAIARRLLGS
jgi:F-type H+-transporting ATPase subunit b